MAPRAIICTHHKCGTVWMAETFRAISKATGVPMARIERGVAPESLPSGPAIVLNAHATWRDPSFDHLRTPNDRLLHVIRDPRDVIISAAHYHASSEERWLHRPMVELGGRTYQQALTALPEGEDRLRFEMRWSSGRVIGGLRAWDYAVSDTLECAYEDLIADTSCDLFGSIAARLGLDETAARRCFWDSSLFGGKAAARLRAPGHVRSGEARQWAKVFTRTLAREFTALFGDVLIRLGYEPDDGWIDRLPERQPASTPEPTSA